MALKVSGLSIYDPIEVGDPKLWIPSQELESVLNDGLRGMSLAGLPLRTRSKVLKTKICELLGYPMPPSFKKTKPRFPGQNFDTYIQKSNNLQVWNEELAPTRRYVIIKVNSEDHIDKVKVVDGASLASLDTTGTLTQKYQARLVFKSDSSELISNLDTVPIQTITSSFSADSLKVHDPTDHVGEDTLMPIRHVFEKLATLIGTHFPDSGFDQERNRGAALHKLVSEALGYKSHRDNGRFPDIANQLLEVKLQTSPTIDLGLVTPDSVERIDMPQIKTVKIRHCDVRYALFSARKEGDQIVITHFFLVTGLDFFTRFPRFEGRVLNKKLQIPLPSNFFN